MTGSEELESYRRQYAEALERAEHLAAECSDEEFLAQPRPGGWSAAQCLLHLNTTNAAYLPRIDKAIGEARLRGRWSGGPFAYGLFACWMMRALEPPVRLRTAAPKVFEPPPAVSREETIREFRVCQQALFGRLDQARGIDLKRAKVLSPVSGWIRIGLGPAFAIIAAHERRHLWQAEQAIRWLRGAR